MDWRLRIPKPIELTSDTPDAYVIEGTGPLPVAELLTPPVVVPPEPSVPPAPPVDTSPFPWPPQPVGHDDPAQRYQALNDGAYAGAQEFQNPLPGSHRYAGDIQVHVKIASWDIFGWRLWVSTATPPATIRRLLATGR